VFVASSASSFCPSRSVSILPPGPEIGSNVNAGHTVEIFDPPAGEVRYAQIVVAILGASSYTYAEATWSQQLPDWIGSHVWALTTCQRGPSSKPIDSQICLVADFEQLDSSFEI
jgi:hypothetical protein